MDGLTESTLVTVQVVTKGMNEKTLKNLCVGPGSLVKNLAMWMLEGFEPPASFVADGNAA